jgi:integrase
MLHWSHTEKKIMEKRFNFTQARIKELPTPNNGRLDYADKEITKLICRVSSTGAKSFIVTKRISGKLKNVTIGKFPDVSVTEARKKAHSILTDLNSGIDPTAAKRKKKASQTTLIEVLELYLSDRELKPLTIKDYRNKLTLGFRDWLEKPISTITEEMVLNRHKKISLSGKTTANTTMRVLRLTLNYAKAVNMIDSTPTDILSKARLWHKNNRKNRVIPSDKLKVWHKAVQDLPNQRAKVYLLMALYMGFRSNELLTLEWEHVNLKTKSILLINTKNNTDHALPIPNAIFSFIKELHIETGSSKWVFASKQFKQSSTEGAKHETPMAVPIKPIKALIKSTGVEFSPHDCRRTFATIAEAVNLPLTMIKRLMNHVTTNDVTGGYIVTEEETLRVALNTIASYIQARVT